MNKLVLAAVLAFPASFASATTMTFETAAGDNVVRMMLDDRANSGAVTFSLESVAGEADLLGLGFNTDLDLAQSDITLLSATNRAGGDSTGQVGFGLRSDATETRGAGRFALYGVGSDANDTTSNCGKGCNFGGANDGAAKQYDYILRLGERGSEGDDYVNTISFMIDGASLSDFSYFGFRGHSHSDRERGMKSTLAHTGTVPDEMIPAVPLPAGGALLLAGLLGTASLRRRGSKT